MWRPRGIRCLAADSRLSQKSWYSPSIFDASGGVNLSTDSSVRKPFQSALRKFQSFTGSLWAGTLNLGGVMREGRCCDHGNFPRTRLSGSRLSWPKLAKARSGLVPTFHRWEEKLAASFELYNSPSCWDRGWWEHVVSWVVFSGSISATAPCARSSLTHPKLNTSSTGSSACSRRDRLVSISGNSATGRATWRHLSSSPRALS